VRLQEDYGVEEKYTEATRKNTKKIRERKTPKIKIPLFRKREKRRGGSGV